MHKFNRIRQVAPMSLMGGHVAVTCRNTLNYIRSVFSRMRRAPTAESIVIKFCTSTAWADLVIYLKRHPNWSKVWEGEGCEISPIPLTLPLASNTAYCATAHTRDRRCQWIIVSGVVCKHT